MMKIGRDLTYLIIALSNFMIISCIEEVDIENFSDSDINPEEILIVEATITDELVNQKIKLSFGGSFTDSSPVRFENNAEIEVVDSDGNVFSFFDSGEGNYFSEIPFAIQQNRSYQLHISTSNGSEYKSSIVENVSRSIIDSVYARRTTGNDGSQGIGIFIDSRNLENTGNFFNYTYEETYKIIAPNWDPFEFIRPGDGTFSVAARTQEERVCFNTRQSNEIIQAQDVSFDSNNLSGFMIRFLDSDNFFISHRYSIEITQQIRSREAFEFYNILSSFSSSENLFSQVQPGLLEGNISGTNSETRVIGYFDVVSVAKKRIFFNREDFFPNGPLPPYPFNCRIFVPSITTEILAGTVEYVGDNDNPGPDGLPYFVTITPCGDCTQLGSNIVPDFWEE